MKEQLALQNILRNKLEESRTKNPAFSVRAFAKRVGLSPATLSLVLNGKRMVSKKLAVKVSEKLMLDPQERSELLGKFPVAKKVHHDEVDLSYLQLTADQYQVVADWKAFAILNLIGTRGFKNSSEWIGSRLGISTENASQVIDRLNRLGMIEIDKNGKMRRSAPRFRTTDDINNISLRKSHYQNLDLARESLDNDSVDIRDFTWLTIPLDTKKLLQAKTLIRKFQDDLRNLLDEGAEPNEVYRLAIQFFPLTKVKGVSK